MKKRRLCTGAPFFRRFPISRPVWRLEKAEQEEVKEILAEARRDAEHTKNEIMAAAQSEAEATRDRALGDIERARDQALKDLFDQVSTQVTAATEHVLGRSLDAADQQRLIAEALADVTAGVD